MKKIYYAPKSKPITVSTESLLAASQEGIPVGNGGGGPAGAKRFQQLIFDDSDDGDVE